jgi:hypothetical protein
LNIIALILFSSFLTWNWGGSPPQFHFLTNSTSLDDSIAKINLTQKQNKMLEIEGTFYNNSGKKINISYKLSAEKSGKSSSSSKQSGNFIINSKEEIVLSKITMNLNKNSLYKIKLQIFKNNQIIAEDNATFYGKEIIQD